jgi:hypothetical protein
MSGAVSSGLFLLAGLLVVARPATATVVEELSIEELAIEASYVVRARVGAQYVHDVRGPRGQIYTRTELTVLTYLKGEGPQALTVQQLGGKFGEFEMHLSGNAQLQPGDEVVLFLDHDASTGLSYVVGLAQGLFRINRTAHSEWVERDLAGLAFYGVGPSPYGLPTLVLGLGDLEERVTGRFQLDGTPRAEEVGR